MTSSRQPFDAERHLDQTRRVGALLAVIDDYLARRRSRDDVVAWCLEARKIRASGAMHWVLESLVNLDERSADGFVLDDVDVRAYADDLRRGEVGGWGEKELLGLVWDVSVIEERTGVPSTRSWVDGLGWALSLPFASLGTGRRFAARKTGSGHDRLILVHAQEGDDRLEAVRDLAETLVLEEADVGWWGEALGPDSLPPWWLWRQDDNGNEVRVARYLAFSAATRAVDAYTARGHKQSYWVQPG
jgi:hypothetical protein